MTFNSTLVNSFRSVVSQHVLKGPASENFRLCGPHGLSHNYSTVDYI